MADDLDVAARLAEGRPAVDNIGEYVWGCHLLGYQNPDLTLHAGQVRDWYSSEDGLDLRALDADRAALSAAAAATEDARRLQDEQLDALSAAWQGRGGDASREFLLRHGEASAAAASALRDAVDALTALRDDLWRTVDDKVAAAMTIDDRRQAERPEWLAATHTVATGTGDRSVASELIDQQVKPFVDNDIRSDWLSAMQKAMAAVSAAFDAATATLGSDPSAMFAVPGDLGPPPAAPVSGAQAEASGTAPAAWPSSAPAATSPSPAPATAAAPAFPAGPDPLAAPMAAPPPATAPAAAAPAMPTMPPLGEMAGGLPGAAGGLAGLGSQLADALGGMFDRPQEDLPESMDEDGLDDDDDPVPDDDEPSEPDDDEESGPGDDKTEPDEPEAEATTAEPEAACVEEPGDEAPSHEPAPTPPPAPVPAPVPPIMEPPPPPEPAADETPCEIAADELPQAGP